MKKFVAAAAVAASMLFAASAAEAQITTDFSFAGTFTGGGYGTVTGHLTFANAGAGVAADGIYIDSATDYFGNPYITTYNGANLLNMLGYVGVNSFTVTDAGQVTSASFNGRQYLSPPNGAGIFFQLNFGFYNTYSIGNGNYGGPSIGNQGGFAGTTYTPAATTSPVPEPASWAMMIVGAGLVGAAFRRRRVSATVAIA